MEKRTKSKFRESVKKSISRDIMTTERQRMFSRRARQYMLAYNAIDNNTNNNEPNEPIAAANAQETDDKKTTFAVIERIIKNYKHTYKTHRSVADSDTGYISRVVSTMKMASFMREQQQQNNVNQEQGSTRTTTTTTKQQRVNNGGAADQR